MPSFTNEEIKAKIADGSIAALSVDTSIFDKYGCNLDFAILRKLDQFKGQPVRVLISEIVENEIVAHIARDAIETQRTLKTAITKHAKRWKLNAEDSTVPAGFVIDGDARASAEQQVAAYIEAIGAEVVPAADNAEIAQEVIRRYFAPEIPFEANDKKKHEFPDAFALLSLDGFGRDEEMLILCVSTDKGWRDFAAQSAHLAYIDNLDTALSYFNEAGDAIAEQVMGLLRAGVTPALVEAIESAFEYRLDDNDFHADGWSSVEFETEAVSAVMQSINWETATPPVVIAMDADSVTFTTKVEALVGFEASFAFSVHDSIDRDYVSLGSEEVYKEEAFVFELALTVSRVLEPELEIFEAEIARKYIEVHFGTVEPFQNENPEHEKY